MNQSSPVSTIHVQRHFTRSKAFHTRLSLIVCLNNPNDSLVIILFYALRLEVNIFLVFFYFPLIMALQSTRRLFCYESAGVTIHSLPLY